MPQLKLKSFIMLSIICLISGSAAGYPIDGYEMSGIRRLVRLQLVLNGERKGTMPLPGAQRSMADIKLNLLGIRGDSLVLLPEIDPKLQKDVEALFPNRHESYALSLVEITPGKPIRYAERLPNQQLSPGSVGKLLIAAGIFTELKSIFPDEPERRRELLKSRMVVADKWIRSDHHEVPIYDPGTGSYQFRIIKEGDVFNMYEWLDHMISASNNSAASVVWKEAILMRAFGKNYPPAYEQEVEFFEKTPKAQLAEMASSIVNDPVRFVGITADEWRLGSFFTGAGQRMVPATGGSVATPRGYMKYLVALERGVLVDQWSCLEIKRLMYMTAKRIRYASAPRLADAAVYFKSGSLYRCRKEEGFTCGKYMGNVENVMNSVAIVEQPDGRIYLVGMMSNVLKKNSAVEHQSLATFIDRILLKR